MRIDVGGITMNVARSVVAVVAALLLTTQAMSAEMDLPARNGGVLIVLGDGSEVRAASSVTIETRAQTMWMDHATGRLELRGEVRIKVVGGGPEAFTITTSSAVITRVAPEKTR